MKFNNSNPAEVGDVFSTVELVSQLGPGRFSTVYSGICRVGRQARAVKIAKSGSQPDLRRFEAEYRILAHCDSPHVVRVFGFGYQPRPHIFMEQLEGETLREYMNRRGGLSVIECLQIGIKICLGLKALHSMGVIHRDLNPRNIIRRPDGHITLLDLGLAKRLPGFRGVVGSLTHPDLRIVTGDMKIGTPGFVPPEAEITEKYDVYGLGGVLYTLHAGKELSLNRDLAVLDELDDDDFADVLAELLAPDPQLRYTLAEAANHIESIVEARIGDVPECEELPKPTPEPTRRWSWWLHWLDLAGLAVAAYAAGLLLFEMGAKSSKVGHVDRPMIIVRDVAERREDASTPELRISPSSGPTPEPRVSPQLRSSEPVSAEEGPGEKPESRPRTAHDNAHTIAGEEGQRPRKRRRTRKPRSQPEQDFRATLKERIKT
ncbi:MAG: serine/threonine-protein kinase, partial [Nannocystaceae bacterium]